MKSWRKITAPVVFSLIFIAGLILGLAMLSVNPGLAHTPDSAEYLAGAGDILSRGLAVLFNPPVHPEFALTVLWFNRPPAYSALLAVIGLLSFLSTETLNFIVLWGLTMLAVMSLYLFLKRKTGGGWVPALVLPVISLAWAGSVMSDNLFLWQLPSFW